MVRIAIPIWLLTASLAWAPETTVRLTILGRGGAEEVEIGPNGGRVPYTLFVETDPLGTPGNFGVSSFLITIETDTGAGQLPVSEFVEPFHYWRPNSGMRLDDDLIGIFARQPLRHFGAIRGIPFAGIGQSGAEALARGSLNIPRGTPGTTFHASIYVNAGRPASSSAFVYGADSPFSSRVPDHLLGNTLTIRVVAEPSFGADLDSDGDVDLADFLRLTQCFTESGQISTEGCQGADT